MKIGQFVLANQLMVAPMAGVTDRPFRQLCRRLGAGYAVSEMVTSRPDLWKSLKTSRRANHDGEPGPVAVQIAGTDVEMMSQAAVYNLERGAQIIDINMGCPAKKVCNKWAGSALMQDESLALEIVAAVVRACEPYRVPVTLKMRTGWSQSHKNALCIARGAESAGVQMVALHGRTREQGYGGCAEHETAALLKSVLRIPVVVNGDIATPEEARDVLLSTGADAVMLGRAAQGRPWIFRHVAHFLATGSHLAQPLVAEVKQWLREHLHDHYSLYGEFVGVLSARKHIGWYVRGLPGGEDFRAHMNTLNSCDAQLQAAADYFDWLAMRMDRLPEPAMHSAKDSVGERLETVA
ncbi:MAG: tRNA dihydrouridine synthase DusB [Burkholderiaceae bacterium]